MCVGKKAAFLGENVMSKKREHMLAMRCGGQGWISQKVDGYYLKCFNTEIGFLYSGGWKMLFMFFMYSDVLLQGCGVFFYRKIP